MVKKTHIYAIAKDCDSTQDRKATTNNVYTSIIIVNLWVYRG